MSRQRLSFVLFPAPPLHPVPWQIYRWEAVQMIDMAHHHERIASGHGPHCLGAKRKRACANYRVDVFYHLDRAAEYRREAALLLELAKSLEGQFPWAS